MYQTDIQAKALYLKEKERNYKQTSRLEGWGFCVQVFTMGGGIRSGICVWVKVSRTGEI